MDGLHHEVLLASSTLRMTMCTHSQPNSVFLDRRYIRVMDRPFFASTGRHCCPSTKDKLTSGGGSRTRRAEGPILVRVESYSEAATSGHRV